MRLSPLIPQSAPRRHGRKFVGFLAHGGADAIHRLGHALRGVTCYVLGQGQTVHFAPRLVQMPDQTLGFREHVVGDGYGSFHTISITAETRLVNLIPGDWTPIEWDKVESSTTFTGTARARP